MFTRSALQTSTSAAKTLFYPFIISTVSVLHITWGLKGLGAFPREIRVTLPSDSRCRSSVSFSYLVDCELDTKEGSYVLLTTLRNEDIADLRIEYQADLVLISLLFKICALGLWTSSGSELVNLP